MGSSTCARTCLSINFGGGWRKATKGTREVVLTTAWWTTLHISMIITSSAVVTSAASRDSLLISWCECGAVIDGFQAALMEKQLSQPSVPLTYFVATYKNALILNSRTYSRLLWQIIKQLVHLVHTSVFDLCSVPLGFWSWMCPDSRGEGLCPCTP